MGALFLSWAEQMSHSAGWSVESQPVLDNFLAWVEEDAERLRPGRSNQRDGFSARWIEQLKDLLPFIHPLSCITPMFIGSKHSEAFAQQY